MNELRWDGRPGHYEVWYLTLTDPTTGRGIWIRQTMVAPEQGEASCAVWFLATGPPYAAKETLPISELDARSTPFQLRTGGCELRPDGMRGSCGEASWELAWQPADQGVSHVHPLLQRSGIARTILTLPGPDLEVSGTIEIAGERLTIDAARGGQAHLWGSKHALRWAWAHCGDFSTHSGEHCPDTWFDAVSVWTPRWGREMGPSTPVVASLRGEPLMATSPVQVVRNASRFGLQGWQFEARDRRRRIVVGIDCQRDEMVGVTYTDPDGELAYCYNSEIASAWLQIHERDGGSWRLRETIRSDRRVHFEYAQREPVPQMPMHLP